MGAGAVIDGPYAAPHYAPERARRGETTWYVDVAFDALLDPECAPLLPRERLRSEAPLSEMRWDIQGSGVGIPAHVARALERAWVVVTGPADVG